MSRQKSLYMTENMTEPDLSVRLGGSVVVFSARCPGKTTDNEDAAAVIPCGADSGVLVVADGMGGGSGGEQASRIAVEAIKKEVVRKPNDELVLRAAILNGIESANRQILDLGIGAATTLAAVEIQKNTIRPYHVGDSSILVVGQRGKIKLQTVAHSPVSLAVEAGVLDGDEALSHEDRHLVTNILGTTDMRIEIGSTIHLAQRDTVLLATDGLFDNLSVPEIIEGMRKGPLLDGLAKITGDAAHRMNGAAHGVPSKPDDLTAIAFRLANVS